MEAEIRPLPEFEYLAPDTLEEVVGLLKKNANGTQLLAGGTDLLIWLKKRVTSPIVIVDINSVAELSFIEMTGDDLHIGATTRLNVIEGSQIVRQKVPVLATAIGLLASPPIRNRATIGGNLCSAWPAADTAPPLLVLDASVTLTGPDGDRSIKLSEFFLGPGQTVKRPDEVLRKITIPCREGRSMFLKLGSRKGATLSIVSAAAFVEIRDERFKDLKVALGAVAPTPILSRKVEGMLKGRGVCKKEIEHAARRIAGEVNPITDTLASATYRKEMAVLLTKRVLTSVALGVK